MRSASDKILEKVKMKCTRLGYDLFFMSLCCCAEAYFAACILMREKAGREVVGGLCNSVLHNTMCMAFSLSSPSDREAERGGGASRKERMEGLKGCWC